VRFKALGLALLGQAAGLADDPGGRPAGPVDAVVVAAVQVAVQPQVARGIRSSSALQKLAVPGCRP
jgi:hypothetical protein